MPEPGYPKLPTLDSLWKQYASGEKSTVANQIGGTVATQIINHKIDTCAIRVSKSLNYSGAPIPPAGGGFPNPYMGDKKVRTFPGGDGMLYIYSTFDLQAYLTGKYGPPKKFKGTAQKADVAGLQGIIFFHFTHVDLWNGQKCVGYLPDGFFGEVSVVGGSILIWPAP